MATLGGSRIHSFEDARRLARRRLPRLVFDFIEGGAGREVAAARNEARFDEIQLMSRVLVDIASRSLATSLLGGNYAVPFGIAPMGMCNLACPCADSSLRRRRRRAHADLLSSAGSSTMEDMQVWAGGKAWFHSMSGQPAVESLPTVDRVADAGYETLILTVDVPKISRRVRDLRNGFTVPFRLTPRSFWDFATHPGWSLRTLAAGVPWPRNYGTSTNYRGFKRGEARAADWKFLRELRSRWTGRLIVKGVKSPDDAVRIRDHGVDAVYVSNHGVGNWTATLHQLTSCPRSGRLSASISPAVRQRSQKWGGCREGARDGADFVMLGRPLLFALGAGGKGGGRAA